MNVYWYHLIIFVVAALCLVAIIITGHSDDPLVTQILSGVVGGAGAVAGGKVLQGIFTPLNSLASPPPNGQKGFARMGALYLLAALSLLMLLSACTSVDGKATSTAQTVEIACASASASLRALTVADAAGELTPDSESRVKAAASALAPLCTGAAPPANPTAAELTALTGAAAELASLQTQFATSK